MASSGGCPHAEAGPGRGSCPLPRCCRWLWSDFSRLEPTIPASSQPASHDTHLHDLTDRPASLPARPILLPPCLLLLALPLLYPLDTPFDRLPLSLPLPHHGGLYSIRCHVSAYNWRCHQLSRRQQQQGARQVVLIGKAGTVEDACQVVVAGGKGTLQ